MNRTFFGAVLLPLASLLACAAPADAPSAALAPAPFAEQAEAIIGGHDSGDDQNHTVYIRVMMDSGAALGTGVLIAPNLVLCALHTVATSNNGNPNGFPCTPGKTTIDVYSLIAAEKIEVFTGKVRPGPKAKPPAATKKIIPMPVTDLCRGDMALLLLESDLPDAVLAPMRLDSLPQVGDEMFAVGWGAYQLSSARPTNRQTIEGMKVLAIGPGQYKPPTGLSTYELYDPHIAVTSGACVGDSGSGLFDQKTGAVVGVLSSGNNDDPDKQSTADEPLKYCDGATLFYVRPQFFKEQILAALKEAGHAPWIEGKPRPGPFGAECQEAAACDTQLCVGGRCSRPCDAEACPDQFECIEGTQGRVCSPVEPTGQGGGGAGPGQSPQGAACQAPGECVSGLCVAVGSGSVCSSFCEASACEGGWECSGVSGRKVCLPPSGPVQKDDGCAVKAAGGGVPGALSWGLIGAALALRAWRRKR